MCEAKKKNLFPKELLIFSTFWKINLFKNKKALYIRKFMYAVMNFVSHNIKIETQLLLWATKSKCEIKETFYGEKEFKTLNSLPWHATFVLTSYSYSLHFLFSPFSTNCKDGWQKLGIWTLYIYIYMFGINIKLGSWVYKDSLR